jgi:DNA-binding transcriptional MerR regulator
MGMIEIDGERHPTISDAATALGVSTRTVNAYISKGLIPPPPTVSQGLREINTFPPEYIEKAKISLKARRQQRRRNLSSNQ